MITPSIYRIVLTGGPCAGKSTAMKRIHSYLQAHGVKVYCVPEAATLLLTGGVYVKDAPLSYMMSFQRGIVRVQLTVEEAFDAFARTVGKPAVLLCDRGVMDGAAYLPPAEWQRLLQEEGLDETQLRQCRYSAVVHLVTAAFGAEHAYNTDSNSVRYEPLQGAREVDLRLREVWRGAPSHFIIDNQQDFERKLHRVVTVVADLIGLPHPSE